MLGYFRGQAVKIYSIETIVRGVKSGRISGVGCGCGVKNGGPDN